MMTHEGTVLIVDDNLHACSSMATLVMLEGFEPIMATNGAKALAYLADHPAPCFIILDMLMPVMDGWEFLACKQEVPQWSKIPVLIATGRDGTIDLDRYPEVVAVVCKPVNPETIFAILKEHHVPQSFH